MSASASGEVVRSAEAGSLRAGLEMLPDSGVGTVVHVHPGRVDVLEWAASHKARKLVAISCDGEVLEALRSVEPPLPSLEIVESWVGERDGELTWLEFNVADANGVLVPSGLRQVFPRLQPTGSAVAPALGLAGLLTARDDLLCAEPGLANVLILEAPGVELDMLRAVPDCVLRRFHWILLRGVQQGLFESGCAPTATQAHLESRFFPVVWRAQDEHAFWPVWLHRHDAVASERHDLQQQVADLQGRLDEAVRLRGIGEEELAALRLERDRAHAQIAEQAMRLETAESEIAQAASAKLNSEQTLEALSASLQGVSRARDEYAHLAEERGARLSGLESELHQVQARHALLKDELVRAEAHVELISDLVFRGPSR